MTKDLKSPPLRKLPKPRKDRATVNADGSQVQQLIDGVKVRPAPTQMDDRGSVCEVFSENWEFDDEALVYAYQVTIRPGMVKGWVVHHEQADRLFFSVGAIKVVLYDARPESPTYGQVNELYFGDNRRALLYIPCHVYHALQNVGPTDALFFNMPTRPYFHDDPDKYRLPLDTEEIPYRFEPRLGG